jgi:hypothetical protein
MACIRFSEESARRRKDLICWLGQPVRIDVETWPGGLVVLTLTPLEGFIHLVADPAACIREYGSYHVSICQRELVSQSELDELCKTWGGLEIVIPVSHVSGEGCMEIGGPLAENRLIRELHHQPGAWYTERPLHISG